MCNKKYFKFILLLMLSLFLISCDNDHNRTNSTQNKNSKNQEVVLYHKRIPVKVVEIKKTWNSNKEQIWSVKVKTDEYKLEETFNQSMSFMHSDEYANDLYYGNVKEGSIIYANLLSWKQGDKVTRRELKELVR